MTNKDGVYITVPKDSYPVISYVADASDRTGAVRYFIDGVEVGKFYIR